MVEGQLKDPLASSIWLKNLERGKVGKSVMELVDDVRKEQRTGRTRSTTWAEGKGKAEKRRVRNTMGYKSRSESSDVA